MSHSGSNLRTINPVPLEEIPKSGPPLNTFLNNVYSDSYGLITEIVSPPKDPWYHHSDKLYGDVKLEISNRDIETPQGTEYWFSRRSIHEDGEDLKWDEILEYRLKSQLSYETEYAPTVARIDRLDLDWDLEGVEIPGWNIIGVNAHVIRHSFPWPFSSRVFPILHIGLSSAVTKEFIVIRLPIAVPPETTAVNFVTKEPVEAITSRDTIGRYISVERAHTTDEDTQMIEWTMCSASDASGNVPMTLQRKSIPDAIGKLIPAFLSFVKAKRVT